MRRGAFHNVRLAPKMSGIAECHLERNGFNLVVVLRLTNLLTLKKR